MSFHGHIRRVTETRLFRVTESLFSGPVSLPPHEHRLPYISLLLAGGYTEHTSATVRSCTLGTVIYHPAGEAHDDRFHRNGAHLISLEFIAPTLLELPAPGSACIASNGLPYDLGLALFRSLNSSDPRIDDPAIELSSCFFTDLLSTARPAWLGRALDYIAERLETPLTLSAAAQAASVHPVHLARGFRRYLHSTMRGYISKLRLRRACDLLRDTRTPIVEVALACGFSDHAHLSRTFRKFTGMTPSGYRSEIGGAASSVAGAASTIA